MKNTKLELDYRSASMKHSLELVLAGAITQDEIRAMSMNLIDGYQIIAPQVSLTSPLEDAMHTGMIDRYDETDHPLTDLGQWADGEPLAPSMHTDEPVNVQHYTISELAEVIANAQWDQLSATMELDELVEPEEDEDEDEDDAPGMV